MYEWLAFFVRFFYKARMMIDTTPISDARSALYAYEFRLKKLSAIAKKQWLKRIRTPRRFVFGWIFFIGLQIVLLFPFYQSVLFGFFLSTIFISLFTTTVLLQVVDTRKKNRIEPLLTEFINHCKKSVSSLDDDIETHRVAIYGLEILFDQIAIDKRSFFKPLEPLAHTLGRLHYQKDLLFTRVSLVKKMISECLCLIQHGPKDLFFHSKLATLHLKLASLLSTSDKNQETSHIKKALDEFLILKEYLPENGWILHSLIDCYGKLEESDKQLAICKELQCLFPQDAKILFTIGEIYFKKGKRAQGLEIYDNLKNIRPELAQTLLKLYTQNHV